MRADKLTTKFQEALADAQSLANVADNAYIEPQHLLLAMLRQDDGPKSLLQRAGVNVAGLAAGGHYDPTHAGKHEGPGKHGHKGDLPLITADAQQNVKAKLHVNGLTTKDIKGRSLMIHAGDDNYSDQPAPLGGGGARIACGVIK